MNKLTRTVIRINNETVDENPVELTHYLSLASGWQDLTETPEKFTKIVYLGKCNYADGDMFACYRNGSILIYKGHLNSGKY